MDYWERIKALREDNDITQNVMAEHLNIAQNTYSQYENGKREIPINILIQICKYFKVSSDYILGLTDSLSLSQITKEHKIYLTYHNEYCFMG